MNFFFSFHDCYSSCCCMSYFFFSNWCIWFFFFITGSIVNLGLLPIFFCHCYISELFIIITIVVVVVVVPIIITFFFLRLLCSFHSSLWFGAFFSFVLYFTFLYVRFSFHPVFFPAHLFNFIYVFFKSIMWFINCNFFLLTIKMKILIFPCTYIYTIHIFNTLNEEKTRIEKRIHVIFIECV